MRISDWSSDVCSSDLFQQQSQIVPAVIVRCTEILIGNVEAAHHQPLAVGDGKLLMIADQITRGAPATEHAELPTRRLEWFKKPSIRVGRSEAVHHQSHIHAPRQRSETAIHHRFPEIRRAPSRESGGQQGKTLVGAVPLTKKTKKK